MRFEAHSVSVSILASILFKPFSSQTSIPAFLTHCLKTCSSSPHEVAKAAKREASRGLLCLPPAQGCGALCSFLISAWAASPGIFQHCRYSQCEEHFPACSSLKTKWKDRREAAKGCVVITEI